jgi:DNA-binding transcriptional LysR family regulator
MIDLAALTSLRAVAASGSVIGAAAALGFSPSAVSQQVKRLERQTGVALLERVGRGVILSEHGRLLVREGSQLLADLERLESGLRRQADSVAGRLRVGTFSTAMRGLVAPAVGELRTRHPDLTVSLAELEPWTAVDAVATGRYDVGVVHRWGDVPIAVPDHLTSLLVTGDVADVILPVGHRLAGRDRLTPVDLADQDWVATPEGTICRQWLTRMYAGTGRRPRIAHESPEYDSQLAMVRAGLGIALIPRLGRSPLGDELTAVPAAEPVPTRDVVAVYRSSMAESPTVAALLAALTRQAQLL